MTQIRTKLFETNSSSSHSLSVSSTGIFENHKANQVIVETGEFGWEQDVYSYFHGKASYILTTLLVTKSRHINNEEDLTEERYLREIFVENDYFLKMLRDVIKEYTGAENVYFRIGRSYYVDHQSSYLIFDEGVMNDEERLKNFLFNTESYVETDNDNH